MIVVTVEPGVLQWACERAGLDVQTLSAYSPPRQVLHDGVS